MTSTPTILWVRRDFRVHDHDALQAAFSRGGPVIPLFIVSPDLESMGAAARWRLGRAVGAYRDILKRYDVPLIVRRGLPGDVLRKLVAETGAGAVFWSRRYDQPGIETDRAIKADLSARGVVAKSFSGFLLFEPWEPETTQGGMFRVFSPFWRNVRDRQVPDLSGPPSHWPKPDAWPEAGAVDLSVLGQAMARGAGVVARYSAPGEDEALERFARFVSDRLERYRLDRDRPDLPATSTMSEYLSYGEISPRRMWHAGRLALAKGVSGAEHFLKEIVWREFAWHLAFHTPHITSANWRADWDSFEWRGDNPDAEAWRRGMTGEPFVDAAMREMYVTGRMHNRARMIAASYLTKHLLTDWRVGQAWFAECLTDWDPASNAMGWQWVAGSGPDAAPYFRIFNPALQAEKFDPDGTYRARWIAEGQRQACADALAYFEAIPEHWGYRPTAIYPKPRISLPEGRARALEALAHAK